MIIQIRVLYYDPNFAISFQVPEAEATDVVAVFRQLRDGYVDKERSAFRFLNVFHDFEKLKSWATDRSVVIL